LKDDLELTPVPEGTRLRLRVSAGAKKTAIVGIHGGALKLSVTAAAEKGKANREVVELLADTFGVPSAAVTITSGKSSKDKVVEITLDLSELCTKLAELELPKKR
jgi:uncharacterized protein (TIGR00251 family)